MAPEGSGVKLLILTAGSSPPALMKQAPPTVRVSVRTSTGITAVTCFCIALLVAGCHRRADPQATAAVAQKAEQKQQAQALTTKENTSPEELEQIPPPSKARYLSVRTADGWANPFLTMHRDTVELRILFPPTAGSQLDGGSNLLHPAAARKQTIDVRLSDLPEALAAVPAYAWPYGRVVAVEESPAAARKDRAQVRRTEESAIQMLNDLGVVVDEWNGNSTTLLH